MKLLKKIIILVTVIATLCVNVSAATWPMILDVGVYTGKLFYCDTIEHKISLVDVSPIKENPTSNDKKTALSAEYEAIDFSGASIRLKGGEIAFESANDYVDSDVTAVIAHTTEGLRVLSIEFK